MRTNHHQPGLWPGLILVSVGGGLLAREFGLLPPQVRIVDFWPLILLCAGISGLLRARGFIGALLALAFAAMGGLLLASNLGFLVFPAVRLWPGLLVLLGIAFLIRAVGGTRGPGPRTDPPAAASQDPFDDSYPDALHEAPSTVDDRLDKQILFSGLELKVESQAWKGGELAVTGGGVEIDLRQARLDPGGALLEVRILVGGVDIRVPDTWQVKNDVIPLLGGADDSTRTAHGSTDAPTLRVIGSVTLGGLSIHN
jgi:predicted membrane protein